MMKLLKNLESGTIVQVVSLAIIAMLIIGVATKTIAISGFIGVVAGFLLGRAVECYNAHNARREEMACAAANAKVAKAFNPRR